MPPPPTKIFWGVKIHFNFESNLGLAHPKFQFITRLSMHAVPCTALVSITYTVNSTQVDVGRLPLC